MPRIAESAASLAADLRARLDRLVAAAMREGRDSALAGVRKLLGGPDTSGTSGRRGPGRPRGSKNKPKAASAKPAPTKSGKKRKNPWAGLSPEARLKRVNAIRKGRGLPLKEKL